MAKKLNMVVEPVETTATIDAPRSVWCLSGVEDSEVEGKTGAMEDER